MKKLDEYLNLTPEYKKQYRINVIKAVNLIAFMFTSSISLIIFFIVVAKMFMLQPSVTSVILMFVSLSIYIGTLYIELKYKD